MGYADRPLAAAEQEQWRRDAADPDNWFEIPEFGVMPDEVDRKGFDFPIVGPGSVGFDRISDRESVRHLVRIARKLIRKDFESIADMRRAYREVLELLEPASGDVGFVVREPAAEISPARRSALVSAFIYSAAMEALQASVRQVPLLSRPFVTSEALSNLAFASSALARWSADSFMTIGDLRKLAARHAAQARHEGGRYAQRLANVKVRWDEEQAKPSPMQDDAFVAAQIELYKELAKPTGKPALMRDPRKLAKRVEAWRKDHEAKPELFSTRRAQPATKKTR